MADNLNKVHVLLLKKIFSLLETYYGQKGHLLSNETKDHIVQTYYRNKLKLYLSLKNNKYAKFEIYKFIFFTLFSQDTSDVLTLNVAKEVEKQAKRKNLDSTTSSENIIEFLSNFFYKHKLRYQFSLRVVGNVIIESILNNKAITFRDLLDCPMIGYKSAAIIYNHFFQDLAYPVVDVNVYKAYNDLMPDLQVKSANKLFELLLSYEDLEQEPEYKKAAKLANLLWYHRKRCKLMKCLRSSSKNQKQNKILCDGCTYIEQKLKDYYLRIKNE